MIIYMVRHGETDKNLLGLIQGQTESKLTKKGIEEAKEIKELVSSLDIDVVISSPLSRALDTAHLITEKDVIVDERLIERNYGLSEGKEPNEDFTKKYWDFKLNTNMNEVEPVKHLLSRVSDFVEDMRNKYPDKKILVVSHSGVLRALHYVLNGIPEDGDLLKIEIPNLRLIEYDI